MQNINYKKNQFTRTATDLFFPKTASDYYSEMLEKETNFIQSHSFHGCIQVLKKVHFFSNVVLTELKVFIYATKKYYVLFGMRGKKLFITSMPCTK